MKRREFFKTTGVAALGSQLACTKPGQSPSPNQGYKIKPFPLLEATITDLQQGMQSGEYTAHSITQLYLERVDEIDKNGPSLNAIIELNPDALEIAQKLDQERKQGNVRSPMHGIPVLIKDNLDTADKMMTTAGSLALEGSITSLDAHTITQLRKAGAIILGKTNLSEWANFRSMRSTSGWSGRGGQTRNPYALDRNPCGSSSGSGAAVSANLCAVAIGTETNGSVVCPSNSNGVVGIKPTLGLVSRSGIIPIAHSQDTAGPMARSVADAALLLSFMAGADAKDPITQNSNTLIDYTQFLDPNGLRGKRIGIARNFFDFHDRADALMQEVIDVLKSQGAEVIDPANIETSGDYGDSSFEVLLYEFKTDLNKYLANLGSNVPVHSLKELIEFNETHRDREMPYFEQEILIMAQERGDLQTPAYLDALKKVKRLSQQDGIDATLKKHNLDAIMAPTGGPAWLTDWVNGDHYSGGSSSPAARAGYPNITVPCGDIFGLPIGVSFFSTAFTEPKLIQIAYSYEQATQLRKAPQFLNTCNFS